MKHTQEQEEARELFRQAAHARDVDRLIELVPFSSYLGLQARFEGEELLFSLPYQERLIGNSAIQALHGGVVAGFMENAAVIQLLILEDRGRVPKPVDFSIDYLRTAKTQDLFASCEVLRQGRRVAQVQISCWQNDRDIPVAVARAHFLLLPRKEVPTDTAGQAV